ncbi:MAG: hypothetical protein ABIH23_30415 [bacterium]
MSFPNQPLAEGTSIVVSVGYCARWEGRVQYSEIEIRPSEAGRRQVDRLWADLHSVVRKKDYLKGQDDEDIWDIHGHLRACHHCLQDPRTCDRFTQYTDAVVCWRIVPRRRNCHCDSCFHQRMLRQGNRRLTATKPCGERHCGAAVDGEYAALVA